MKSTYKFLIKHFNHQNFLDFCKPISYERRKEKVNEGWVTLVQNKKKSITSPVGHWNYTLYICMETDTLQCFVLLLLLSKDVSIYFSLRTVVSFDRCSADINCTFLFHPKSIIGILKWCCKLKRRFQLDNIKRIIFPMDNHFD